MPELRRDPTTGRLTVIATERAARPEVFCLAKENFSSSPKDCPFCPGNEDMTPQEVFALRPPGRSPNDDGWQVRVIPNKFPAFTLKDLEGEGGWVKEGLHESSPAVGIHEVIINTPDHLRGLSLMEPSEIEMVLATYLVRLASLKAYPHLKSSIVIINHGQRAGASMEHPHSQLFSMANEIPLLKTEMATAKLYFEDKGRCIYCDIVQEEAQAKERVLLESDHFLSLLPFASRFPFEIWILPKRHSKDFESLTEEEKGDLAVLLKRVTYKIQVGLNDPSYNLYIHSDGFDDGAGCYYHWHIEMIPRLINLAGFEMGSGMMINIASPEKAVKILAPI
ncbi:MAG: galactose-1-phosphate uridylyltransferase [Actinomycetota bacterium]|nr:galactose-1-phosphate uridylyltransferase [Actinomycetota bacterium]